MKDNIYLCVGSLICCLHVREGGNSPPVVLFKSETLGKCENILTIRKQQDLKYKEIYLPETINDKDGFHLDCYRRFTAVSKAQKDKYNEVLNRECSVANKSSDQIKLSYNDKERKPYIFKNLSFL